MKEFCSKVIMTICYTLCMIALVIELPFKLSCTILYCLFYPLAKHSYTFSEYSVKYTGGFIIAKNIYKLYY